jgi:hypothetical protein
MIGEMASFAIVDVGILGPDKSFRNAESIFGGGGYSCCACVVRNSSQLVAKGIMRI